MNILLLTAHSVAEYDDLRMFTDMGHDTFSIGAYSEPANPGDLQRPALPLAPDHPELRALCEEQREKHGDPELDWAIDWAKADLHQSIIDWADVIIAHHYLDRWIYPQWARFMGKRVIWRTCGQSDPWLEHLMRPLAQRGLSIVRYSPKERAALDVFAGEHALIRFGKYPEDWGGWTGTQEFVTNFTQNMAGRGEHVGLSFWLAATEGLPAHPGGADSEKLPGGRGALSFDDMRWFLQRSRAYLYTGTVPASYTLGFIEALMTGTPVVSIGRGRWYGDPDLFEADEIAPIVAHSVAEARSQLGKLLADPAYAEAISAQGRDRALELFGIDAVSAQWASFLENGR